MPADKARMPEVAERVLSGHLLPLRLSELPSPPSTLYVRGPLPGGPCVAVVGTREPTADAARFARVFAKELAAKGVCVASGGASGIDAAAHEGALEAGGHTLVVAPSGFEKPYPNENGTLFRRVLEGGGTYVSLVPAATAATPAAFFSRNACLAALAHALVIVEAPWRSGARNAAAHARRLRRPVFVVPAPPWNASGNGAIVELKLGALPLTSSRDVLEWLAERGLHGLPRRATRRAQRNVENTGGLEPREQILEALSVAPLFPEQLAQKVGLSLASVQLAVLALRLEGLLIADASGLLGLRERPAP